MAVDEARVHELNMARELWSLSLNKERAGQTSSLSSVMDRTVGGREE